jgi:hypothetical protein
MQVTGKEILLVKQVLQALNEAFPVVTPGIPTQKWVNGKLINTFVKEDPYFLAYKDLVWWICLIHYPIWDEAYPYMKQFCDLIEQETGFRAHPCRHHPISMARYKDLHLQKKVFMLGDVSWHPAKVQG